VDDWRYWLALSRARGVGPRKFLRLIETLGSPERVFSRTCGEVAAAISVTLETAKGILENRPGRFEDEQMEAMARTGTRLVTFLSDEYPPLLRTIYDPPPFLFARGRCLLELFRIEGVPGADRPWVAVVGSRKATAYGRAVAREISFGLARAGAVVVSGMAQGIDSCAHRGALDAGGDTVAVLGTGVDVAYPASNRGLIAEACRSGAVLSEFPMGEGPEPWHFPMRNRVISGMCRATVVIEAGETSGALITADLALDQGRDVMAVPGPAGAPMSRGTNRLIRQGAALVESAGDVLAALGIEARAVHREAPREQGVPDGPAVMSFLDAGPATVDQICEGTGFDAGRVMSCLTVLELEGLVEKGQGAVYCKRRMAE
jgi:DNA processing protein